MWPNLQETADLVTFTEETLNGKLIFCAFKADGDYIFIKLWEIVKNYKN